MLTNNHDFDNLSLYALASAGDDDGLFTNSVDTMLAVSYSIEEAVMQHRLQGTFFAGFQRLSAFTIQLSRYRRLAASCGEVVVFAYPDQPVPEVTGITIVPLDEDHPLVGEWFIVFAASEFLIALLTRQLDVEAFPDRRGRLYHGLVTMDPRVVLEAQAVLAIMLGQRPVREQISIDADHNVFSPLLTFNTELIGYLEARNRELASMYRRVSEQNVSLEQLQEIVRTLVSRTAWEEAELRSTQPSLKERRPEKERLTVMVSDIQGFTGLTERRPLARVVADLNQYFDILASAVYQEHGDVDKFMGDGMLAFFYDPVAALRAARRILERIEAFNARRAFPFVTRLALVTGPCVVGRLGSRDRQEITIMGDTVNTASRLQEYAPAGGIIMDGGTHAVCAVTGAEEIVTEIAGKRGAVAAFVLDAEWVTAAAGREALEPPAR